MKTFIASLCALAALLGLITLNASFIHRTANTLEKHVEALTPNSENSLLELESYWQQKKTLIGLSVSTDMIRDIDERIAEIRIAIADDKGDAAHKHGGLAASRTRQNQEGMIDGKDRLALTLVERGIGFFKELALDGEIALFDG